VLSQQNYGKAVSRQQSGGQARPQFFNDLQERSTMKSQKLTQDCTRILALCLLASVGVPSLSRAQIPVFEITPLDSSIKFHVKSSTTIAGKFDKWDASLTFTSPDETTGVLEITIQAASVDTGSGMKNRKLKSKDFFDAEQNPVITFKSTKIVQTGPNTYEVDGDFTIRGVANPEKLTLAISGRGTDSGEIRGAMIFNRKDYGMNKGIPFIKIADHVDVNFHLKGKRVSGPPLAFKQ
jgi:polyisoprenoid-binding protein YceI